MNPTILRRFAIAAALAVTLGAGAVTVAAQPMHGHGHDGGDIVMTIARLKSQLNLDTSQQTLWDSAVAAGKSARSTMQANRENVRAVLNAELAKSEPDLAAVASAADHAQTQAMGLRRQVRDAWLALYNTFTPGQKAVVKTALQNRLARADSWRAKMQERHGQGQ